MDEDQEMLTLLSEVLESLNKVQSKVGTLESKVKTLERASESKARTARDHLVLLEAVNKNLVPHSKNLLEASKKWKEGAAAQNKALSDLGELSQAKKSLESASEEITTQLKGLRLRWALVPALVVLIGAMSWIVVHQPEPRSQESLTNEKRGEWYEEKVLNLSEKERQRLLDRLNNPKTTKELVFAPEPQTTQDKPKRSKKRRRKKN